jgi:hypothetical protein
MDIAAVRVQAGRRSGSEPDPAVVPYPKARRLSNIGLQVLGSSPEECSTQIREEIVAKGRVVKAAGARAD